MTRIFTVQKKNGSIILTSSFGLVYIDWETPPHAGMAFKYKNRSYLIHDVQSIPDSTNIEVFAIPQ